MIFKFILLVFIEKDKNCFFQITKKFQIEKIVILLFIKFFSRYAQDVEVTHEIVFKGKHKNIYIRRNLIF